MKPPSLHPWPFWEQSANNGVANDRSWPQWPNCYIFLVVQYFIHDGCSPVSIIIWCKNLHTSCSLPCFLSAPELLLFYFLLFFFFFFLGPWSASQAICYCLWIHIHSNIGQFYFYRKWRQKARTNFGECRLVWDPILKIEMSWLICYVGNRSKDIAIR